jgi:ATP-dependent Clp protease ATP-binding subunit ClpA
MFERFTVEAREVVVRAKQESRDLHHPRIGTEHLLLALLSDQAGVAYAVLHEAGLDAARVRAEIERLVGTPPPLLSDTDAAALRTIGIDLDAVLARIEESFGPDALNAAPPPGRRGLLRRGRRGGSGFTPRAKKVLELSLREAIRLNHRSIGTEHILLGMIRDGSGLAARILTDAGVTLDDLRRATLAALGRAA